MLGASLSALEVTRVMGRMTVSASPLPAAAARAVRRSVAIFERE
jgi:hypothetical protein